MPRSAKIGWLIFVFFLVRMLIFGPSPPPSDPVERELFARFDISETIIPAILLTVMGIALIMTVIFSLRAERIRRQIFKSELASIQRRRASLTTKESRK